MAKLFQRILVPYDFSDHSRHALEVACDLAAENSGEVIAVCALEPVSSLAGIRPPGGPIWYPPDDVIASERARLEAAVAEVRGRRKIATRATIVVGAPLEVILAAAKRADVIVMATTGRGALSHLLVGSVAEKVVRHAPVPVLTIGREAMRRAGGAGKQGRRTR
ncbi:universal stress protein [Candidatus Binatia bacterium]|jgi:nucleotide-binding universal stress UspA family protein|nr:universal stress protein [Candidatus Binatia bacterium]